MKINLAGKLRPPGHTDYIRSALLITTLALAAC
jgi:hypothetical protein